MDFATLGCFFKLSNLINPFDISGIKKPASHGTFSQFQVWICVPMLNPDGVICPGSQKRESGKRDSHG